MTLLNDLREKHPEYKDVPDDKLADGLYNKFYKDKISREDFNSKVGMSSQRNWGGSIPINPEAPPQQPNQKIPNRISDEIKDVWSPELGYPKDKSVLGEWKGKPISEEGANSFIAKPARAGLAAADYISRIPASIPVAAAVADVAQKFGMSETNANRLYRDLKMGGQVAFDSEPTSQPKKISEKKSFSPLQKVQDSARKVLGYNEERAKDIRPLVESGTKVSPSSYLDSAPSAQRHVDISQNLGYDPLEKGAKEATKTRTLDILKKSGEENPEKKLEEIQKPYRKPLEESGRDIKSALSSEYANLRNSAEEDKNYGTERTIYRNKLDEEGAKTEVSINTKNAKEQTDKKITEAEAQYRSTVDKLRRSISKNEGSAQKLIDNGWKSIDKMRTSSPNGLAQDVAQKIKDFKKEVSDHAQKLYANVASVAGTARVPVTLIDQAAADFIQSMPEDLRNNSPMLIKQLQDLGSGSMPFTEMHKLRSMLRDIGYSPSLEPSFKKGPYKYLSNAVEAQLNQAATESTVIERAKGQLDKADAFYSKEMARFRSKELQSLVDNIKSGFPPDPATVARQIENSDNSAARKEILKIVGPQVRQKIASAHLSDLIENAKDPMTDRVNVKDLMESVDKMRKSGVLQDFYGQQSSHIVKLTERLGKQTKMITLDAGNDGNFVKLLQNANKRADALQAMSKPDPIRMMEMAMRGVNEQSKEIMSQMENVTSERTREQNIKNQSTDKQIDLMERNDRLYQAVVKQSDEAEAAANALLRRPELLRDAVSRFGVDHPAIKMLQKDVLEASLSKAISSKNHADLDLSKLTREQQETLFPNGLDKNIRELDKILSNIYGQKTRSAPSLATGAILGSKIQKRLPAIAMHQSLAYLVTHPAFTKFFINEFGKSTKKGNGAFMELSKRIYSLNRAKGLPQKQQQEQQQQQDNSVQGSDVGWRERYK